jgi:glycosyltransferase involved in cell wall biosynthesis
MPKISIIIATYNGAKYLSEQINSVLNQSYKEWQLIIRDDGSVDTTLEVIKEYTRKYPEKIQLLCFAIRMISGYPIRLKLLLIR